MKKQLDPLIHAPVRLRVMTLLANEPEMAFMELVRQADTSIGNLSVHLARLEKAGYVRIRKLFVGKKPQTRIAATPKGLKAYYDYLNTLKQMIPWPPQSHSDDSE